MAKPPTPKKYKKQKFIVVVTVEIRDGPVPKKNIRDIVNQELKFLNDDVTAKVRSVSLVNTFTPDME